MDLSVIVVTKNEAANIGRCIESILADTQGLTAEIIVVDSRSDDGTVEIAQTYPVMVAQFTADALITSHAGRYVGTLLSTGRYLCYLDGDMIVIPGWIPAALAILKMGEVQGVAGRLFRVRPGEAPSTSHIDNYTMGLTHGFGGAGVYHGDLIRAVGPYNPYMRGEGEREMGFRLRQAGGKLLRVDVPMVYHMDKPRTAGEVDEKAGMFAGIGQIFRRYPTKEITLALLKAHRLIFFEIAVVWFLLVSPLVLLVLGYPLAASVVAALALTASIGLILWKGAGKTGLYIRSRVMNSVHIIRGLFLGLREAKEYTPSYDIIRKAS